MCQVTATEANLRALEDRVRSGRLEDPAKIGAAAQRILASGGAARLFDTEIGPGHILYHYSEDTHAYEELLAGRYVLATSLTPTQADIRDPDLGHQHLTAARALRDLNRIRRHKLSANGRRITLTTRRSPKPEPSPPIRRAGLDPTPTLVSAQGAPS